MDYLAILRSLDSGKAGVEAPSDELNELNEKSPAMRADPAELGPYCPGPEKCTGCYSVGIVDDRERFIHPPKASPDWEAWLARWEPKGKAQ